jgi:hypothetical protein
VVDGGVVGVGGAGKTERGDKDKDKGDKDTDKDKDKRPKDGGGKEGAGGWAAAGKEKHKFQFDPKMLTGADNRSTGGEDQEKELEMVEAALRALVEEQPSNVTAIYGAVQLPARCARGRLGDGAVQRLAPPRCGKRSEKSVYSEFRIVNILGGFE